MMLCMCHQAGTMKCIQYCYDAEYVSPDRNSEMYSVLLRCRVLAGGREEPSGGDGADREGEAGADRETGRHDTAGKHSVRKGQQFLPCASLEI